MLCLMLMLTHIQDQVLTSNLFLQALSSGKIGDSIVFVPDADGHLAEARELCYDDAPWMAHNDARLIHPDISNQVRASVLCCSGGGPG